MSSLEFILLCVVKRDIIIFWNSTSGRIKVFTSVPTFTFIPNQSCFHFWKPSSHCTLGQANPPSVELTKELMSTLAITVFLWSREPSAFRMAGIRSPRTGLVSLPSWTCGGQCWAASSWKKGIGGFRCGCPFLFQGGSSGESFRRSQVGLALGAAAIRIDF